MAGEYLPIAVPRNGVYSKRWNIKDEATGEPIDLTGWNFALDIKYAAGDADPPLGSGAVTVYDAGEGALNVLVDGTDFAAVPGTHETVRLAYDLVATVAGTGALVIASGPLLLEPGVTI
jgi:hypothetical protein